MFLSSSSPSCGGPPRPSTSFSRCLPPLAPVTLPSVCPHSPLPRCIRILVHVHASIPASYPPSILAFRSLSLLYVVVRRTTFVAPPRLSSHVSNSCNFTHAPHHTPCSVSLPFCIFFSISTLHPRPLHPSWSRLNPCLPFHITSTHTRPMLRSPSPSRSTSAARAALCCPTASIRRRSSEPPRSSLRRERAPSCRSRTNGKEKDRCS